MDIGFWGDPRAGGWWRRGERHGRRGMRRFRRGVLKLAMLEAFGRGAAPRLRPDTRDSREGLGRRRGLRLSDPGGARGRRADRRTRRGRPPDLRDHREGPWLAGEHAAELERFLNDEEEDDEGDASAGSADRLRASAGRLMQSVAQLGPSSKPETVDRVCELLDEARKEIYKLLAEE